MLALKRKCLQNQRSLQGPQLHDAPGSTRIVEELQLPSLEAHGPRPEPERFAIRYILNDGSMPQEEYEQQARKASEAFKRLPDMERARREAEAAEHEAHESSIAEWEAKLQAKELDHPALPSGPPPQAASSMRELPNVHEALRQNDPS